MKSPPPRHMPEASSVEVDVEEDLKPGNSDNGLG